MVLVLYEWRRKMLMAKGGAWFVLWMTRGKRKNGPFFVTFEFEFSFARSEKINELTTK